MKHALIYHGKFELNHARLSAGTRTMRLLNGSSRALPRTSADGIKFGYMTRGKSEFLVVKADDVVFENPVALMFGRHTGAKGVAPSPTTVSSEHAKTLLDDIGMANPSLRSQLSRLYSSAGLRAPSPSNKSAPQDALPEIADVEEIDTTAGTEGALKLRRHLVRERDRNLVRRKRAAVLQERGNLACEVCGLDFARRYPSVGAGFCEVHHKLPLEQRDGVSTTPLEDLAIVCANCHRMLHRGNPVFSLEELSALLA